MSNTFAGQSVYKDLEAAEEKIEQLEADSDNQHSELLRVKKIAEQLEDVIKALRKGPRQIDLSSCEARVKELDGKIEQLQDSLKAESGELAEEQQINYRLRGDIEQLESKLIIAMGCINEIAKLTAPGGFPSYTHLWYLTAKATDAIDALAQPLKDKP